MTDDKRDEALEVILNYNGFLFEEVIEWHKAEVEKEKKRWLESILPEKRCTYIHQEEPFNNEVIEDDTAIGFNEAIDEIKKNGGIK